MNHFGKVMLILSMTLTVVLWSFIVLSYMNPRRWLKFIAILLQVIILKKELVVSQPYTMVDSGDNF